MSVEPEPMASPHLPPEVIQMMFRNLGFFDLIRCKRVCKNWAASLPSNDFELSRKLFVKDDLTGKSEEEAQSEDLPTTTIKIKTHPNFPATSDGFYFKTLEELKWKTCLPEDHEYNDGSWKNMMLCEPAVEQVELRFDWSPYERTRTFALDGLGKGVTVSRFVKAIRFFLKDMGEDVKSFAHQIAVSCCSCKRNQNECERSRSKLYSDSDSDSDSDIEKTWEWKDQKQ